jgi:isopentenyldiphosphate isomerase
MIYNSPDEWFPIVNEDGTEISRALRSVCHNGKSKLLHPVVHMHLFNSKGELFLQKRAITKDLLPGYWDTSVGGHVSPGESPEEALKRETFEELGLIEFSYKFIRKYVWESAREKELVYSFTGSSEIYPLINRDEIDEGRFWLPEEIEESLDKSIFTPNFKHEFKLIVITL